MAQSHAPDIALRRSAKQAAVLAAELGGALIAHKPPRVDRSGLAARAGRRYRPDPGTKRVARVEENTAADRIELSAEQIERLNDLKPAAGERHDEGNMAVIDR